MLLPSIKPRPKLSIVSISLYLCLEIIGFYFQYGGLIFRFVISFTSYCFSLGFEFSGKKIAEALQVVLSECNPKAKIVDLCEKGDAFIREYDMI